ncbi:MAG TPA: hypothetical protein PKY82_26120 [Pyrinomonadaceae bacterium]|nr:hypothetical protein [Pyrinomonadaceae bacterium]
MATIENVKMGRNGTSIVYDQHANISDLVGVGQRNERNDVMAVQALFKMISLDGGVKIKLGLQESDFPEPTGEFNEKTIHLIRVFQLRMGNRLLNADGKIHPANYKNRFLGNAFSQGSRLMMITLLNIMARDAQVTIGANSTLEAIQKFAPSIVITVIP